MWEHVPYRNQATVQAWINEYLTAHPAPAGSVSVLEKNFTPSPDSGMVVVSLANAPTITFIQPVIQDGRPRWVVTFEERSQALDLTGTEVAQLAAEFAGIASLCEFLQVKTEAAMTELHAPTPAMSDEVGQVTSSDAPT